MLKHKVSSKTRDIDVVAKITNFDMACVLDPTTTGKSLFCGSDDHMAPEIIQLWGNDDLPEKKRVKT
jgi:hypothetical protein